MSVRLILNPDGLTAMLSGEIDHHTASELRREIDGTASKTHPETLKLDFSGVTFMDSSGVGLIMGRYKLINVWGGRLIVANLPEKLERIVSLAGLSGLCTMVKEDSHETAE